MLETNYSYGIERDEAQLARNDADPTKWTNPLEVRFVAYSTIRFCAWHLHSGYRTLLRWRYTASMGMVKTQRYVSQCAVVPPLISFSFSGRTGEPYAFILTFADSNSNRYARGDYVHDGGIADSDVGKCDDDAEDKNCQAKPLGVPQVRSSFIDAAYSNESIFPKVNFCVISLSRSPRTRRNRLETVLNLVKATVLWVW